MFDQCTQLEATHDFTTFEGRSRRAFAKGQRVWVCTTRNETERLGIVKLERKGQNAAHGQYFSVADVEANFRLVGD